MHFLLTFQEVMPISKTRNQLIRLRSGVTELEGIAAGTAPLGHGF